MLCISTQGRNKQRKLIATAPLSLAARYLRLSITTQHFNGVNYDFRELSGSTFFIFKEYAVVETVALGSKEATKTHTNFRPKTNNEFS